MSETLPSMDELLERAYQKGIEYAADKMLREYKLLPMTFSIDECDKLMEYVAKQLKEGKNEYSRTNTNR